LNEATTLDQIAQQAIRGMEHTFKSKVMIFYAEAPDKLRTFPASAEYASLNDLDRQAASWVLKHGDCAGKFTPNLPLAEAFYAPLITSGGVTGVLALRLEQSFPLTIQQLNLLDSFSQQIAFALDRHRLRDISERAKLLAESERLSKSLLNSVSHEMRTPIAVIKSAVNNLLYLEESDDRKTRSDIMSALQDATERLNRLVGNLLNIARLESGHVKPRIAECDVSELIRVAKANTESEFAGRKVNVELAPDLPFAAVDFNLMEQVLTNLLSNAAIHTTRGTPVDIRARAERQSIAIEVADRGSGIPPESMGRLFEKFYRGPSAPTGGTGLGLSLVKGFLEAQGGTVEVMNRLGGGAVFAVRVPLAHMESIALEACA
jgi:two-component system sensor histidine kinase KdpD